jgi:hypothetical protein
LLITEVGFAGTDITAEPMRLPGHQARALWVLVHHPMAFHNARRIALAEMQLARHSDPKLTMAVYGRAHLHDLGLRAVLSTAENAAL